MTRADKLTGQILELLRKYDRYDESVVVVLVGLASEDRTLLVNVLSQRK